MWDGRGVSVCLSLFISLLAASGFHEASSSALPSSTGTFRFTKTQTQEPANCGLSLLSLRQTQSSPNKTFSQEFVQEKKSQATASAYNVGVKMPIHLKRLRIYFPSDLNMGNHALGTQIQVTLNDV